MIAQLRGDGAPTSGLSDRISRQLHSAISMGLLVHGDKLPPENIFAEQLGVSSLTLRQALAVLRQLGLIETRRGRRGGSYVSSPPLASQHDLLRVLRQQSPDGLRDLGDLAASVAAGIGRYAALRSDEQDWRRLTDLNQRFRNSSSQNELRRTDTRFHIALGVASQSRRLTNTTIQIFSDLASLTWLDEATSKAVGQANEEHEQILEAIRHRDAGSAERLAGEHFERETEELIDFYFKQITGSSEDQ